MSQTQTRAVLGYPPPPKDEKERMRIFLRNRPNFPADEWLRHSGRHYAMSWDGLVIHASDSDFDDLLRHLDAMGIDSNHVVFGSLADSDSEMGLAGSDIELIPSHMLSRDLGHTNST